LLIIGGRYGSTTAEGISYTEKEYEYALERNLKVIALLHASPDLIPYEKSEQDKKLRTRLKAFRTKASKGRLVEYWQNAEQLSGIVALSPINTIKLFPAIGWVRADKVSSEELLIEINELRKQNEELNKALSKIEPSIFIGREEKDFSYIYDKLNRLEDIEVKTYKTEITKKYSINLASLIPFISKPDIHEYRWNLISSIILNEIFQRNPEEIGNFQITEIENMADELMIYGFLTKNYAPPVTNGNGMLGFPISLGSHYDLVFSEKLGRYKYWLDVNGKMPKHIEIYEGNGLASK
jgi:hypothetical protein